MEIAFYLFLVVILLFLNAFFVIAEFSAVKIRPSQMEALASKGDIRAKMMLHIQTHLEQYLSVCQIGVTLTSVGLGFVGEPSFAAMIALIFHKMGFGDGAPNSAAHGLAISMSYVLISYMHIVIGELAPKNFAIRRAEKAALNTAFPLHFFYYLFFIPHRILNWSVGIVLFFLKIKKEPGQENHSEDEIRLILEDSQSGGMMSFRRLLYIENVLDMGPLSVRDSMRPREKVHLLRTSASQEENDRVIFESKQSRYPLIGDDPGNPLGYVHVKDIFLAMRSGNPAANLTDFLRPCLKAKESDPLETVLSKMQRRGNHVALVYDDKGVWTGFVTMEDILEEVVGAIEEEFPLEAPVYLSDTLTPGHVLLDVEGNSVVEATRAALTRINQVELPLPIDSIMLSIAEREKLISTYLGKKLATPHARLKGLAKPIVIVARLKRPIPAPLPNETINILFILLTPASMPRIHQAILSKIAGIFDSEFLEMRLWDTSTPEQLHNAICVAEQAAL
jgi:CBS domain containing-hemolysin-like protein/mannitol/fructose-specific phosphotransferase system IIA component